MKIKNYSIHYDLNTMIYVQLSDIITKNIKPLNFLSNKFDPNVTFTEELFFEKVNNRINVNQIIENALKEKTLKEYPKLNQTNYATIIDLNLNYTLQKIIQNGYLNFCKFLIF
jgi:hypothetical protein